VRGRAAVFVFHDVVAAERWNEVPVTHRPYALAPEELRAFLLAASMSSRRAIPVGQLPQELGGAFYSLTFDDGCASDYTHVFPVLQELGLRATFFVVPTLVGVGSRAPLMHNGCAATVADRIKNVSCGGGDAHGKTSQLSDTQKADLVTFLRSL